MSHETQGTGYDPGAAGHELQGRESKPKRKPARRAKPAAAKAPDEFAGLTPHDCCVDCTANKCVISGMNVCGHPYKTSHPGADPKLFARIARAKKVLAHQKVEARRE